MAAEIDQGGMHYSEPDAVGCLDALVRLGGRATSREIRRIHNREAIHTSISNLREYQRRQGYQGETVRTVWMHWRGSERKRPVYHLRQDVLQGCEPKQTALFDTARRFKD